MNVTNKTAGGKQFWADVWFFHDWRIQRHALTGHCRLLDGANQRHASGTLDACRETLDEIRRRDNLPAMQGKAVVILHGLFRTRSAMGRLRSAVADGGQYSVFCMGYPTTRGSVADHAQSLDSVVSSLEGITEINFVAHSLGNLVVRHWVKDLADGNRSLPAGQSFGRMVMLAPPNNQPQLATKLLRWQFTTFIAGAAAEQMATGWEDLEPRLTSPPFEFGILAGGKGDGRGYNPLLPGDDDGVVTVESTRLTGARDFRCLPVLHSFFMNDRRVHEMAKTFLAQGYFESEETRQPVDPA
jgi:pimeloyl-ACP methyl ester carboxylesterase